MSSSAEMIIPNVWENKIHVPNHQPLMHGSLSRLPLSVDDDHGFVTLASYALERPQLDVGLHDGVRKLAANQTLRIKDLGMVHRHVSVAKHDFCFSNSKP